MMCHTLGPSSSSSSSSSTQTMRRGTVLVTGSTDGIGLTTAKHLVLNGYNVLVHGKEEKKIQSTVQTIKSFCDHQQRSRRRRNNNNNYNSRRQQQQQQPSTTTDSDDRMMGLIIPLPATDISTVEGCVRLTDNVKTALQQNHGLSLTVVLNNAGVYCDRYQRTEDGLEMTFAVNVLAPFVITSHLLSELMSSYPQDNQDTKKKKTIKKKSRIIIASSISQSRTVRDWSKVAGEQYNNDDNFNNNNKYYPSYSAHGSYGESKLLDAMLTMEMSSRLRDHPHQNTTTTCNCLDPGTVNTKMLLAGWGPIGIDVEDALDEFWLCGGDGGGGVVGNINDDDDKNTIDIDVTGQYFISRIPRRGATSAYDRHERDTLWHLLTRLAPEAAKEWDRALSTSISSTGS